MSGARLCLCGILLALVGGPAWGHGGVPVATKVLPRGEQLLVSTQYWGTFVGGGGTPWRWICDEAINGFMLRETYQGLDGTLYATDFPGLSISHDGGCTFVPATGAAAAVLVNGMVNDPAGAGGRSAWLSGNSDGIVGTLLRTDDAGQHFTAVHPADPGQDPSRHLMRGILLSPDRRLHVLVDQGEAHDQPVIYTSADGGAHFGMTPIKPILAGVAPGRVRPIYVDPRDGAVYVHFQGDETHVLVRVDTVAGTSVEVLRTGGYLFDALVDPARDRGLVAAADGLYLADGAALLRRSPALSTAQCLTLSGDQLYVCSSSFAPDLAAVARSADHGTNFGKVFQFPDTVGVLLCPASTPVAQVCPAVWARDAELLGASPNPGGPGDGGGDSASPSCQVGGRGQGDWGAAGLLLLGLAAGLRRLRRVWLFE